MKRLTSERCSGIKSGYWSPAKKDELVQRLGKYEDTGLEPEEIRHPLSVSLEAASSPVGGAKGCGDGWISVEERLPEWAGVPVMAVGVNSFGQRDMFIAFRGYGDSKWHSSTTGIATKDEDPERGWTVTHWRPLPGMPEEDVG